MLSMNLMSSLFLYLHSLMMVILYKNHFLYLIISLEFMTVSILYNVYNIVSCYEIKMLYIYIILIIGVCESALGVSLLVLMIRMFGNDYMNSLSLLKW